MIDTAGQAQVAFVRGAAVYVAMGFNGFASPVEISAAQGPGSSAALPALTQNSVGVTYVAFVKQEKGLPPALAWTSNRGGPFKDPVTVQGASIDEPDRPAIEIMRGGEVFLGCSGGGKIFVSMAGNAAKQVLSGEQASFAVDRNGVIHVAYIRSEDLFYANSTGGSFQNNGERITNTNLAESAPQICVTSDGFPYVLYRAHAANGTEVYLTGGNWSRHRRLFANAPLWKSESIQVIKETGEYLATFLRDGSIWAETGTLESPGEPGDIGELPQGAGAIELLETSMDKYSRLHVLFIESGELLYTNNAPAPDASFRASPTEGLVPLEVQFDNTSTGHVLEYRWHFGDGGTSRRENPEHLYTEAGNYTVTLKAVGTGGILSEAVKEDFIRVEPKKNHLRIPGMLVYGGAESIRVPVQATNELPLQGFQIAATFDPGQISFLPGEDFVDFAWTASARLEPEFIGATNNPEEGYLTLGVIYDITPPLDGKVLRPGKEEVIVYLAGRIKETQAERQEIPLNLRNGVGDPPVSNSFTVGGSTSVSPALHSAVIEVIRDPDMTLGPSFVRGRVNDDTRIELPDAVFLLEYILGRGREPGCLDSADINDDGRIDIADPVRLLSFLFLGRYFPPPPFPAPGLDPTRDDPLDCKI